MTKQLLDIQNNEFKKCFQKWEHFYNKIITFKG